MKRSPIGKGGRPGSTSGEISGVRPGLSATEPLESPQYSPLRRRSIPDMKSGVCEKVGVVRDDPALRWLVHPLAGSAPHGLW